MWGRQGDDRTRESGVDEGVGGGGSGVGGWEREGGGRENGEDDAGGGRELLIEGRRVACLDAIIDLHLSERAVHAACCHCRSATQENRLICRTRAMDEMGHTPWKSS